MNADLNRRTLSSHGRGVLVSSVPLEFELAIGAELRSVSVLPHAPFSDQTKKEQSMDTRAWQLPNPAITTPTSHAEAALQVAIPATRKDRAHG